MNNDHTFKPGLYRHYRGGMYTAIALVTHHHRRSKMVVYLSHTTGEMNVRPLVGWIDDQDAWNDEVVAEIDGVKRLVKRFSFVEVPT